MKPQCVTIIVFEVEKKRFYYSINRISKDVNYNQIGYLSILATKINFNKVFES